MSENKEYNVGDKVQLTTKRYSKIIPIVGIIKEKRSKYNRTEYLVGDAKVEDIWVRTVESVQK